MYKRLDRAHRAIPLTLGVVTLISVGVLLAWHVSPKFFPTRAHDFLAAFPLTYDRDCLPPSSERALTSSKGIR